jgi:hypothetical protein
MFAVRFTGFYTVKKDGSLDKASLTTLTREDMDWVQQRYNWQRKVLKRDYGLAVEPGEYPIGTLYSMTQVRFNVH